MPKGEITLASTITRATERSANQTLLHITQEADLSLASEAGIEEEIEEVSGSSLLDSEEEEDSIEADILEAKEEISFLKTAATSPEAVSEGLEDVRIFFLIIILNLF